jgi:Restriction alleviation protein Lar
VMDYEFRGDGRDYSPTEDEREIIEDAIEGYLALAGRHRMTDGNAPVARGYPEDDELRRCPFCGGKPFLHGPDNPGHEYWISCQSCQASSLMRSNYDATRAAWNARPLGVAQPPNETYHETVRRVAAAREKGYAAARANLQEAWSALAMIRETIETLAPSGSVKAAEHLDGPTFMHEAEALVAGILALSSARSTEGK